MENVAALAYPVSATRAIVIGPLTALEQLGSVEEPIGESWLRLVKQVLGASGEFGDLAQAADGRLVRLTAESAKLLRANQVVAGPHGSLLGVVRNPANGQFAGVLSFQTGALIGAAAAMPALLGAIALQRQLATIERKLDEIQAELQYVIDQIHLEIEGDLVASLEILDSVYRRAQRTGEMDDDDWLRAAGVEKTIRSLHHQTSRRLNQLAAQLVPGGSVGTRVERLKAVLQQQHARYWLTAHVQAELALTKWQWLEVMRIAQKDAPDLENVVRETEAQIVARRDALSHLARQLGAFVAVGDEDFIDRMRFILRRRLSDLADDLDQTLRAFSFDLEPLGVDVKVPIPLGTGEEEEDPAWRRLMDQLKSGRRFVDQVVDAGEKVAQPVRRRIDGWRKPE